MQKLAYGIIGYVSRASPGLTAGRGLKQLNVVSFAQSPRQFRHEAFLFAPVQIFDDRRAGDLGTGAAFKTGLLGQSHFDFVGQSQADSGHVMHFVIRFEFRY